MMVIPWPSSSALPPKPVGFSLKQKRPLGWFEPVTKTFCWMRSRESTYSVPSCWLAEWRCQDRRWFQLLTGHVRWFGSAEEAAPPGRFLISSRDQRGWQPSVTVNAPPPSQCSFWDFHLWPEGLLMQQYHRGANNLEERIKVEIMVIMEVNNERSLLSVGVGAL